MNITRGAKLMNATVVWSILAFLVGGTAGFVAGVKFGKKDYVRRIDDLTDENEWLSTKAHDYSVKNDILIEKMEKLVDAPLEDLRRADRRTMVELSQKYKDPDFDEHFAEREGPSDDEPFRPPFEITEAEFNDDFAFSDSSCVSYYQDDGVLADERDEPFDFPNEILGKNIIDMLDVGDCPDHVYVHNDWTDTNYDVTLERGMNFRKDILGDMGEEEE